MAAKANTTTCHAFGTAFKLLTRGHNPFPWQVRLYERFISGGGGGDNIPAIVSLPTGLGKTSVIAIWLIALMNHPEKIPRRLVYVVNRRTVVDQTTVEVEQLRKYLRENLSVLKSKLKFKTLAVSTLRGQYADNHEWFADPSRPAVICGTVDMIGSRLLFGGYRIGFKSRPLHAGFLGQDVLLVHDEAHLEPAFQELIETIQKEQQHESEHANGLPWPKLRVMAISATTRDHASQAPAPFTLTSDDQKHPIVKQRIEAAKSLSLHPCDDESSKLVAKMVQLAWQYKTSKAAVLIFARKVDNVENIANGLTKKLKGEKLPRNVATLTGTMRGYERDELVRSNKVFARFMPPADCSTDVTPVEEAAYLVCTSAGEVGVNLSAHHMVCDLSTFDSMAQRLGRVNRFGEYNDTQIHVVYPTSFGKKDKNGKTKISDLDERRQKTLVLLKALNGDASPAAIEELDPSERAAAFAPEPDILPATDILFDAWAMTTIRDKMPGRPPVEPYLHGVAEWEPPRTSVAWRDEVELITKLLEYDGLDLPRELLEDYPLKPHELLSDRTDRIFEKLKELTKEHKAAPIWLIEADGTVTVTTLEKLMEPEKKRVISRLANLTVLLPPSIGGLHDGLLDGKTKHSDDMAYDVADCWYEGKEQTVQHRLRVWDDTEPPAGMAMIRTIDTKPLADEFDTTQDDAETDGETHSKTDGITGSSGSSGRFWHWYARPCDAENALRTSATPITWDHHTRDVVERATDIVDALGLPKDLKQAVVLAAKLHDLGKKRELWQRSIGNPDPTDWYAKSGKPTDSPRWRPRRLNDYRHEFGSLLDMLDPDQSHLVEFGQLDDEMRDLVLHLVAAHHGYARPHFPLPTTIDPGHPQVHADDAAIEVPRRYARLQRKFGRWGLAYLESLLRAADWAASAEPSEAKSAESGEKTKEGRS